MRRPGKQLSPPPRRAEGTTCVCGSDGAGAVPVDDAILDDRVTSAPATEHRHRHEEAECANGHQDDADHVEVRVRNCSVDAKGENRTDRNQEHTHTDAHSWALLQDGAVNCDRGCQKGSRGWPNDAAGPVMRALLHSIGLTI